MKFPKGHGHFGNLPVIIMSVLYNKIKRIR